MNNRILYAVIVVLILVGGYLLLTRNTATPASQEKATETAQEDADGKDRAVYTGQTPCADCEGIDIKLALKENGKYRMTSTYLGKDVEPLIEKGTWTMRKGDATNPDADVYILTQDSGKAMNFLVEGNTLKQLDESLTPLDNPYAITLTQKK